MPCAQSAGVHRGLPYPFSVFPARPGSHRAYDLARPSLITTLREGRSHRIW